MPWDAKRDALREDASYLVQTSAIDSLSAFPGDDTRAAAMRLSASRHPLVRGYAYICAGMAGRLLGDEVRAGLRNRLSAIRETDTFAKICLLESLIHLGDETPAAGLIRRPVQLPEPMCHPEQPVGRVSGNQPFITRENPAILPGACRPGYVCGCPGGV